MARWTGGPLQVQSSDWDPATANALGTPKPGTVVTIKPSQAFVVLGSLEVVDSPIHPIVAADGTYTWQGYANADLSPAGGYYIVSLRAPDGGSYKYTVQVPAATDGHGGTGLVGAPFAMTWIQTGVLPTASPSPAHVSTLVVERDCTYRGCAGNYFDFVSGAPGDFIRLLMSGCTSTDHLLGGIYACGQGSVITGNSLRNLNPGSGIGYDGGTHVANRSKNLVANNSLDNLVVSLVNGQYGDVVGVNA